VVCGQRKGRRRARRTLSVGVALGLALIVLTGGCGGTSAPPKKESTPTSTGFRGAKAGASGPAPDFALPDQAGHIVRLSAQRGKIVLLTFLYTNCPDVCPLIASSLNETLRELGRQRDSVRVLAVSTDPVHDTRPAVRRYVATHQLLPGFRYLIGSADELKPIWQAYNILVEQRSPERVLHTTYVLLIDRSGKPRYYYTPHVQAADLLHDLKRLL
jgi:protein SCO1/2